MLQVLFTFTFMIFSHSYAADGNVVKHTWYSDALIIFGSIFVLLSSIGVLRFPDFYTRLHAATKLLTFGGLSIFVGAGLAFWPQGVTERFFLIVFFFFLTAPLSGYMIARAGYLRGIKPATEPESVDQWQALGDEAEPSAKPQFVDL